MTYSSDEILSARIRPAQQRVELDVNVRSRGANYSTSRGENYAKLVELSSRDPSGDDQVYRRCGLSDNRIWGKTIVSFFYVVVYGIDTL